MATTLANMKKDLQKLVKRFRDAQPDMHSTKWDGTPYTYRSEYPKAMMTSQQMTNNTATINCGHSRSERSQNNARDLIAYPPFVEWVQKYNVKSVQVELNPDNCYQVRVRY